MAELLTGERATLFMHAVEVEELVRKLQETAKTHPSRQLSLAITKLEEGAHWLGDCVANAVPDA